MKKLNPKHKEILRRIVKKATKKTYKQYKGAFDKLGDCSEPTKIKMVGNPTEWEIE